MSLRGHPLKSALHNKECSCEDTRPRLSCRAQPGMWDRSLTRSVERSSIGFHGGRNKVTASHYFYIYDSGSG